MMSYLRRYFISGLLVWLPIWVTILVIKFLVEMLDTVLLFLPAGYQPDALFGMHIPGIGLLLILVIIFGTGMVAANFLGKRLVSIWDAFVNRIPLVRTIHAGVKQVLQTLFAPGGQSFRKVFLVEYPRQGIWTIAFQTGDAMPMTETPLDNNELINLYVPTTPNPTSGFLLIVPKKDAIELDMKVEQALKFVISLGVVQPNGKDIIVNKG